VAGADTDAEATDEAELTEDEDLLEEAAEAFAVAEPISYFGTDFDVHGLVRRLNEGDIVVPIFNPPGDPEGDLAGFQRAFVWRKYQMDRFVESLLLGYPVPGIFLVQQPDRKLLVLDGQQRLRTLQRFYSGSLEDGSSYVLEHVGEEYVDKGYTELSPEERRALDNNFIHATVIKYDPESGGDESIYQLFERLNASGSNLYPHEIRVALYPGKLVEFVAALNAEPAWRALYGNRSPRLKDQEQILRFLALYIEAAHYTRPLKGFLNNFLKTHRNLEGLNVEDLKARFIATCELLAAGPGGRAFRLTRQVNAALVDSVMVGLTRRLDKGPVDDPSNVTKALNRLLADEEFQTSIARATADEERVATRLQKATDAFAAI
jgi:hypothetical protein